MKKIAFIFACIAISLTSYSQKGKVRIGANLGFTTGASNSLLAIGGDVDYLFTVDEKFEVGAATGLILVTDVNATLLPVAFAGRFNASNKIDLGVDVGYAVGINNTENGFYFRPMFEYKVGNKISLRASYSGIEDDGILNFGAMFGL
ncbi:hypothetical protein C7447_102371 [Tenacibaculum adriaticum]|uniref:Outer membrane protein with beta-barrel domain n=1 Tax=Tenacibaculum adriaticum TaxID=413713 RepID=A0A5S5DT02_9FLAO|nr:hypothetical protein [Tenacibaculum adriaticum]TYP99053.1 hypothetical protein C7447_102371 [Tenacibaculum adriaticum]